MNPLASPGNHATDEQKHMCAKTRCTRGRPTITCRLSAAADMRRTTRGSAFHAAHTPRAANYCRRRPIPYAQARRTVVAKFSCTRGPSTRRTSARKRSQIAAAKAVAACTPFCAIAQSMVSGTVDRKSASPSLTSIRSTVPDTLDAGLDVASKSSAGRCQEPLLSTHIVMAACKAATVPDTTSGSPIDSQRFQTPLWRSLPTKAANYLDVNNPAVNHTAAPERSSLDLAA
jgi:hypothetical protein